ncbi:MAG: ABC transporter ATP-binding protein [Lentisphaerae bacterium]|nr:ABC transporter ATP-binding protein [Lentisphaerota bacterium]
MSSVKISDLCKSFIPGKRVLDELSLEVGQGELFFMLGPSGCGKSTLLRILAGLEKQDSGTIEFDGVEISNLPPEKRQAAMMFQNYALWPHLTVFENVAFGLRIMGFRGSRLNEQVSSALDAVQLADFGERRVPSLSGGQQQRVALARALAVRPAVLLLDEPLSNLDARLRDTMRNEIARICRERNQTAIYVTHDRQEALSMADRMAVLKDGRISQCGTPREVYDHPVNRFCASFLGDVNFISGEVSGDKLETGFGTFALSGNCAGASCGAIRPERIRFVSASGGKNAFSAEITGGTFHGDSAEWFCRAGEVTLAVRESAPPERRAGDKVFLAFDDGFLLAME